MREQLAQYVELLFAGARDCEDIKQEILQNTLDRYDDLIAEGKVPEAAYRLAITGIGDINEILGTSSKSTPTAPLSIAEKTAQGDTSGKKLLRAIAIGLYIVCMLPLILLSELGMSTIGFCVTVVIVAVATVIMILTAKKEEPEKAAPVSHDPKTELHISISSLLGVIGLAVYLVVSFATGAWYITWLIFPITGAVKGLVKAIIDLKEAMEHEN